MSGQFWICDPDTGLAQMALVHGALNGVEGKAAVLDRWRQMVRAGHLMVVRLEAWRASGVVLLALERTAAGAQLHVYALAADGRGLGEVMPVAVAAVDRLAGLLGADRIVCETGSPAMVRLLRRWGYGVTEWRCERVVPQ